jgi:hypothetical protein
MNFDVNGPFVLKRYGMKIKILEKRTKLELKKTIEKIEGLSHARGSLCFCS